MGKPLFSVRGLCLALHPMHGGQGPIKPTELHHWQKSRSNAKVTKPDAAEPTVLSVKITESVTRSTFWALINLISSHLVGMLGGFNTAAGINKNETVYYLILLWWVQRVISWSRKWQIGAVPLQQQKHKEVCLFGPHYNVVFPLNFKAASDKLWQV